MTPRFPLRPVVLRRLQHWSLQTKTTLDDLVVALLERSVFPLLYVGSGYAALAYLQLPAPLARGCTCCFSSSPPFMC
ncbi:hypothetical protein V9K67_26335 [Paraflavisolibacter sp. H34]|uniref:hypothetical protein n=1 Tax=Huijunlia imazamoxiresistens TaxID=3127457 RepID=UPI0030162AB6